VACGPIAVDDSDNIGEVGVPLVECEPQEMRLNSSPSWLKRIFSLTMSSSLEVDVKQPLIQPQNP